MTWECGRCAETIAESTNFVAVQSSSDNLRGRVYSTSRAGVPRAVGQFDAEVQKTRRGTTPQASNGQRCLQKKKRMGLAIRFVFLLGG